MQHSNPKKRSRMTFNKGQKRALEEAFRRASPQYGKCVIDTAHALGVPMVRVRKWFDNRTQRQRGREPLPNHAPPPPSPPPPPSRTRPRRARATIKQEPLDVVPPPPCDPPPDDIDGIVEVHTPSPLSSLFDAQALASGLTAQPWSVCGTASCRIKKIASLNPPLLSDSVAGPLLALSCVVNVQPGPLTRAPFCASPRVKTMPAYSAATWRTRSGGRSWRVAMTKASRRYLTAATVKRESACIAVLFAPPNK